MLPTIEWPQGKRFAFTVFDDTDHTTLENGPFLYSFLHEIGLSTTKSVWPLPATRSARIGGSTCSDPNYAAWVRELQDQGFEIALHNATCHTSSRRETLEGLEEFRRLFGRYPSAHANHAYCEDAIYWGDARVTGVNRLVYNALTRGRNRGRFTGHVEGSDLFWGDRCRTVVSYVRNFVYSDINTLKACPMMPYSDSLRPYVNAWFASSEGHDCGAFCRTIAEDEQDRLEAEGGACIMYTHFGTPGFYSPTGLDERFVQLMRRLASKDGWFVPVSVLLDYLKEQHRIHAITSSERSRLERAWIMDKVLRTRGTT